MTRTAFNHLLQKYNVQGPRYTSYPTVPYWADSPHADEWIDALNAELEKSRARGSGAALYLHIPFCENLCTFCACNKRITKNHQRSRPYIDAITREWDMYRERLNDGRAIDVTEIHIGGGTPTFFSPDELRRTLEPILSTLTLTPHAELSFEADPRVTTEAHLKTLHALGFTRMSFGIQDFDPVVQDMINRVQSVEQVRTLTEAARRIGYHSLNYDLVYGLPCQTPDSIRLTMEAVCALRPDRIAFYAYAHVPWLLNGQRKFTDADLPEGEQKRTLYEQGRTLLMDAGYTEIGLDHFALPHDTLYQAVENKTLYRNFMGYMSQHVSPLIGLGCSSIGDAWTCYAQNEKEVEAYQDAVMAGRLPLVRGHKLTPEDAIIRRHILNLMTRLHTDWSDAGQFTDYLLDVPQRLRPLEDDALIELSGTQVQVLERGKPFLRNICMAFDARLTRAAPQQPLFSKTI